MLQNKFNLKELEYYLKEHPNTKNKELYIVFNALTDSQKSSLRRKKATILNKKGVADIPGEITSLTPDTVEKLIKDKLNNKSNIPDTQIRMALDYLIKLKITDESGMEQLDMEAFLKHELSERQE